MKRALMFAVVAIVFTSGCGGPKPSEPRASGAKEDPRIQRATSGSATQTDSLKKAGGKAQR